MTQDEANNFVKQFGVKILTEVKAVKAVAAVPDSNEFKIDLGNPKGEDGKVEILNMLQSLIPGLQPQEFNFSKCNELAFFAPYPVCSMFDSNATGVVKGSCGPFIERNGSDGRIGILSSEHVMPDSGKFDIAQLHHMDAVSAKVVFKNATFDIGIGELKKTDVNGWSKFETSIAKAQFGDPVSHFGGSSVEESAGSIVSTNATVKFKDSNGGEQFFSNVIKLQISSRHGDSGSPVVTADNEVIGLIIGGDTQNNVAYCSNLELANAAFDNTYRNQQLWLNGTPDRPDEVVLNNRRREIELQLHSGKVIKEPATGVFGEIITDSPQVSVLIHPHHSIHPPNSVDLEKSVWFFAVPLEYIVKQEEMVGINNQTPLVAINMTNDPKKLQPLAGLHKRTPCGTGTTISAEPEPVMIAMSGGSPESSNIKSNLIINDYGHLVFARKPGAQINSWDKIICKSGITGRKSSGKATDKFERRLLDSEFENDDPNWKWE